MQIELLWFDGCPNYRRTLALLSEVVREHGTRRRVTSIRVTDDAMAQSLRFSGSPTIRVDGVDIEPGFIDQAEYALRCRVYRTSDGPRGVPERGWIEAALDPSDRSRRR